MEFGDRVVFEPLRVVAERFGEVVGDGRGPQGTLMVTDEESIPQLTPCWWIMLYRDSFCKLMLRWSVRKSSVSLGCG